MKNDYQNIVLSDLDTYLGNFESIFGHIHRPIDLDTKKYDKNIAFFGCSLTYGEGVKNEDTYPSQIQKLSNDEFNCLNFGVPGGSIDLAYVIYNKVIKKLDIDWIVIQWPYFDRRMYFKDDSYIGYYPKDGKTITEPFRKLADDNYVVFRNLSNLQVINSFKRIFNLSPKIGHEQRELFELYDIDNILKFPFYFDTGWEWKIEGDGHPNEKWYKKYSKYLYKELISVV